MIQSSIMKSFVYRGVVIAFCLVVSAVPASAQTSDLVALQALVTQLQAQVASLAQALSTRSGAAVPSSPSTRSSGAVLLSRSLARGMRGDDVRALQEALATMPEVYPEKLVTGYFGPLTEAAVRRFEEFRGLSNHAGGAYGRTEVAPEVVARIIETSRGLTTTPLSSAPAPSEVPGVGSSSLPRAVPSRGIIDPTPQGFPASPTPVPLPATSSVATSLPLSSSSSIPTPSSSAATSSVPTQKPCDPQVMLATGWDECNHGRQTYNTLGRGDGPQIRQFVIDPFDALAGENYAWRVKVFYSSPITSVRVILTLDNGVTEHELRLVEGTATDGWWEASWSMPGTTRSKYIGQIVVRSGLARAENTAVFRNQ